MNNKNLWTAIIVTMSKPIIFFKMKYKLVVYVDISENRYSAEVIKTL